MCKIPENMELYNEFRDCPAEAKKKITGGNLNGKTDINPMWRIKRLTEEFGPCGFGWRIEIVRTWIEEGADGVRVANVQINLYVHYKGEWSEAIPGIGGATIVDKQTKGLVTDDDAFKKAYTDAQSVACKALGIAADVYFERDPESKNNNDGDGSNGNGSNGNGNNANGNNGNGNNTPPKQSKYQQIKDVLATKTSINMDSVNQWIFAKWGKAIKINDLRDEQFKELYTAIGGVK